MRKWDSVSNLLKLVLCAILIQTPLMYLVRMSITNCVTKTFIGCKSCVHGELLCLSFMGSHGTQTYNKMPISVLISIAETSCHNFYIIVGGLSMHLIN